MTDEEWRIETENRLNCCAELFKTKEKETILDFISTERNHSKHPAGESSK